MNILNSDQDNQDNQDLDYLGHLGHPIIEKYIAFEHDFLIDRVQLKISSYLLLSLHLAATLVIKWLLALPEDVYRSLQQYNPLWYPKTP